jgi:8-oxo-dGTP pyrophosphatase MutT (NUDIX family)
VSEEAAILPLVGVEAWFDAGPWPWAEEHRAEIDAHWARRKAESPALYNGRVLVCCERRVEGGILKVRYREADYASFLAMRDLGFPPGSAGNCFAMAALQAADGAYLLGIMGGHTANPGRIYFPAGTPDPGDVLPDGRVDLAGSVSRELLEETGLGARDVTIEETWTAVIDGARTALMRPVRSPLPAAVLKARIEAWLAQQDQPELSGMHIVRTPADIDAERMPCFTQLFLRHLLRG